MMSQAHIEFTPERLEKFRALVAKYEEPACALLPTMYLAQEQFGFLSPSVLEYVAKLLSMPAARVFEAASFYILFKRKDMGRYCLQVCNNITCTMMGAQTLNRIIREELSIGPMEVTTDGMFSFMPVQCLGSCDTAPVVQVNEDYVEKLDPEKFRALLKRLRQGEAAAVQPEATL